MQPTLESCNITEEEYQNWLHNVSAKQSENEKIDNLLYVIEKLLEIAPDGYSQSELAAHHLAKCAYACESRRLKDKQQNEEEQQYRVQEAITKIQDMDCGDFEEALNRAGYNDYSE